MTITEVTKENLVDDHIHQIPAPEIVLVQKLLATKTNHHHFCPYIQHREVACYKKRKEIVCEDEGGKNPNVKFLIHLSISILRHFLQILATLFQFAGYF